MRVLEASFLSFVWKRVIFLKHIDLPCLSFVTFPESIYVDVLDACFSEGRESFEIIHQITGCQDNVVMPLTPLIFRCGEEL